jgi:hypothetical protein
VYKTESMARGPRATPHPPGRRILSVASTEQGQPATFDCYRRHERNHHSLWAGFDSLYGLWFGWRVLTGSPCAYGIVMDPLPRIHLS